MLRHALVGLLALPLATTALAQESIVAGADSSETVIGMLGGATSVACTGRPDDSIVIRHADGSLYAAGTLAQFTGKGRAKSVGPIKVTVVSFADASLGDSAGIDPALGDATLNEGDPNPLPAPGTMQLILTIPKTSMRFHQGEVAVYRGAKLVDADPIKLR